MEANLRNRLTFGPLLLGGLLGILWLDWWLQHLTGIRGIGLLALLVAVLPLATIEVTRLFAAEQVRPYRTVAGLAGGLLVFHAFLIQFDPFSRWATPTLALLLTGIFIAAALRKAFCKEVEDAIRRMAGTLLAATYLGGLAWFLMAVRVERDTPGVGGFDGSTFHIITILLCVKFTDIGAYFTGKSIGKRKLIFWLSPGKTWEGLAGGLVFAGLVGLACSPLVPDLAWWQGIVFGVIVGAAGQAGDLLESLMKRDAQVKDSGTLLPGFGGILDVIDSPLVAAPVAWAVLSLF